MGGRSAVVACKRQKKTTSTGARTTNLQRSTAPVRVALFMRKPNIRPGHPTVLYSSNRCCINESNHVEPSKNTQIVVNDNLFRCNLTPSHHTHHTSMPSPDDDSIVLEKGIEVQGRCRSVSGCQGIGKRLVVRDPCDQDSCSQLPIPSPNGATVSAYSWGRVGGVRLRDFLCCRQCVTCEDGDTRSQQRLRA